MAPGAAAAVYEGGFVDPSRDGARAFRVILEALARPGRVQQVPPHGTPAPWFSATGALILALSDTETPLWIDAARAPHAEALAAWAAFHTGAPRMAAEAEAVFAIGSWAALAPLTRWRAGTPDYPDDGTTLIVEVPSLESGRPMVLRGPGIDGEARIAPSLPDGAAKALMANGARYPLGLDFFFVCGDRLLGLPRSSRVSLAEGG